MSNPKAFLLPPLSALEVRVTHADLSLSRDVSGPAALGRMKQAPSLGSATWAVFAGASTATSQSMFELAHLNLKKRALPCIRPCDSLSRCIHRQGTPTDQSPPPCSRMPTTPLHKRLRPCSQLRDILREQSLPSYSPWPTSLLHESLRRCSQLRENV